MEPKTVVELQLRHTDTRIDLSNNNNLVSVLFEFLYLTACTCDNFICLCIWRPLTGPFQAPRQLRVALRFSLRRSHYLIASNRQVVYGLNLFHSRLPLCPLALAPPQFYTADRVCDRLSQMVVLFATLKRMP